jgi:D-3-phosphoglycerate dehydrogenase
MNVRIVVPDDFPSLFSGSPAEHRLRGLGALTVHAERGTEQAAELARRIADADVVLGLRAYSRYTAAVLDEAPRLRLISLWGTGTDNVDLDACRARGITVTNTAGVNANAVAEHALALMLAVARRIPTLDAGMRAGQWPRSELTGLGGKTLGVIGLGAIGERVARLGAALGMRVLVYTNTDDRGRAARIGATAVPIDDLLRGSDVVSLHLRLTGDTEGFLDRPRLGVMKPGAILINTARGKLVDRRALYDALRDGRLGGAGLDVFHEEPLPPDDPLRRMPNTVLTPHNAGLSREVIDAGFQCAVENIECFLRGVPRNVVV